MFNSINELRVEHENTMFIYAKSGGTLIPPIAGRLPVPADMLAELNTSNLALRTYTWGWDLSGTMQGAGGVGGLLWMSEITGGAVTESHFAAYDGNGNVAALVKASNGTETARYEYGPFGEPIRMTGAKCKVNPFQFSTKFTDDETGMAYYGYRFYNASTGRWPNRDPIGDRPRRSHSKRWLREQANLYHFTFNDPVNRQDVLGLAVNDVHVVTFPIDKLNCPSTCGPDYTASVNSEIARLRGNLAGLPEFPQHEEIMDAEAQGGIATYNLSQFYSWFARLVELPGAARWEADGRELIGLPNRLPRPRYDELTRQCGIPQTDNRRRLLDNALPASERCPGQLKRVVSRVCFNSARPVRLRSSARENHSSIAEPSGAIGAAAQARE